MRHALSESPLLDIGGADGGLSAEGAAAAAPTCLCCVESDPADRTPGRYKLWELDPGSHCSIIGTCLGLDDLRRIIRKADLAIAPDAQDYDIHGHFVTRVGTRSPLSKLVQKTLDRKYAPQLARFRRSCTPEELWGLWRQAMTSGDVAGAYWALMTHKAAPREMRIRAHNEVHMLSHLMGKSSRDDIKRLRQLEALCAELTERLAKTRARADAVLRERDARIGALGAQLAAARSAARAQPAPDPPPGGGKRDVELDRLRARFATMERRLRVERARARAAEGRLADLEGRAEAASPRRAPTPREEAPETCERPCALHGCALLYVGGYRDVMPRLRAHVEGMRGTFLYHDGGIEMQPLRLPGLVSQADAVFCPVGCISHDACLRLKRLCKRHGKPFVPLRSAGLSGFVTAVGAFAQGA
jgi:hypothetical protein